MKYTVLLFLITITLSCNNSKQSVVVGQKLYFDLEKYITNDIAFNQKHNIKENKKIEINGKLDEQINANVDWQKEMSLIEECDINKANWIGKYLIDSIWKADSILLSIQYIAKDTKIPVKKMTVFYDAVANPEKIIIQKKIKSILFDTEQQIEYVPTKSFSINAQQKAFFMNDFNSKVSVNFIQ